MNLKERLKKNKIVMNMYRCYQKVVYGAATIISPKLNTAMWYRKTFKKKWDPSNPVTLNDKVLWLKLNTYYNNPLVKQCADKYRVREYIESIGCGETLNELIAVYKRIEDIEWDKLPDSFAMKLNVGCGYNIIVPDKSVLDIDSAKKKLKKWMKEKQYLTYSEMQYKGVEPVILVEKYLKPKTGVLPEDYKFFCFNGEAPYVMVCTGRNTEEHTKFWYFTPQWEMQMMTHAALQYGAEMHIPKPNGIDTAFEMAKKISKGFPFVRVDFYIVDGKVIFGEMTFTPSGGLDGGRIRATDELLGSFVKLETK